MLTSALLRSCFFFFFNDTATTEIYTLSLHDALPIYPRITEVAKPLQQPVDEALKHRSRVLRRGERSGPRPADRKSTRLNSSHGYISYAVFCLKKKKHNKVKCLIRQSHQRDLHNVAV